MMVMVMVMMMIINNNNNNNNSSSFCNFCLKLLLNWSKWNFKTCKLKTRLFRNTSLLRKLHVRCRLVRCVLHVKKNSFKMNLISSILYPHLCVWDGAIDDWRNCVISDLCADTVLVLIYHCVAGDKGIIFSSHSVFLESNKTGRIDVKRPATKTRRLSPFPIWRLWRNL